MKKGKFPMPHEVKGPEGIEGWEKMYYTEAYSFTPPGMDPERERYENSIWKFII